ncbi:MAG: DUF362 domain-containing protein [Lachnospiraceae bacterium]|nr:DUF362 domain-containing protein [Lachnospiraceae bacterium]
MNNTVILKKLPENNRGYGNQRQIDQAVGEGLRNFFQQVYGKKIEECIKSNDTVVLKPNFVAEMNFNVSRDKQEMEHPNDCFITNIAVIKGILKELNKIKDLKVMIAESPMQFCRMDEILTEEFWKEMQEVYQGEIEFVDLRRTIMDLTKKPVEVQTGLRGMEHYVDFDLKQDSMHQKKIKYVRRFRVTDYPPREMHKFHTKEKHVYRIARELIEAQWIINVPKLKTHMKAGMTGAMKNFVGVVGNKECLPHHIKGSPLTGGDCHKDVSIVKFLSENLLDGANTLIGTHKYLYYPLWLCAHGLVAVRSRFTKEKDLAGAWYGNDTIWRTVHDLNVCLYYGRSDGSLADSPQREIITITDAVVSGEKEGPMNPWPKYLNAIVIGNSTFCVDMVNAALMRFDGKFLFHYQEVKGDKKYPLFDGESPLKVYGDNQKRLTLKEIGQTEALYHEAAKGWQEKLNRSVWQSKGNSEKYF